LISPGRAKLVDRAALLALCLLLAAALAMRLFDHEDVARGTEKTGEGEAVDLGAGVSLPRGAAGHRRVLLSACQPPVMIDFVDPSSHGRDASTTVLPNPGDQVFYAYRGWTLGGRLATAEMAMMHFAWRAGAILRMDGAGGRNALAIKVTVPDGCTARPEDALATMRRDVLARR
jgi:hypothetical protein